MRGTNRSVAALGMALAWAAVGLNPGALLAQSPEQIRRFQSLSAEQRAAAIQAAEQAAAVQRTEERPLDTPVVVTPAPAEPTGPSPIESRYAGRTNAPSLGQSASERAVGGGLKQFGYDLFAGAPTTFAPATDIPVPADYVIGPGDTIEVQLFGKENQQYSLVVTRDGRINFPQFGALSVNGLKFTELRADLEKRVAEQMIGVKAAITMGALRSIRVFVLGDVIRPGSYTVSSLSTMTNALFVSGGIKPIGSLRNVQLKRNGRVVTRLDLYDLLLRGDTSDDARLQPGDVIFVPPIGQTAGVGGEVRRPAIYELRGENTVRQLAEIAGGLLPTAVPRLSQLERLDPRGNLTLIDVNLDGDAAQGLADGDVLRIYRTLDRMDGVVLLAGHVRRPGGVSWRDDMRLADLIPSADHLLPQPDLDYVVIRREERPLAKVKVFSTRLGQAWANPASDANVLLEPRDQVFVFTQRNVEQQSALTKVGLNEGALGSEEVASARQSLLKPLLEDLARQSGSNEPTRVVSVGGLVREPGNYPLEAGMAVSDLVRAGGGLSEAAYTLGAEVTRYEVVAPTDNAATLRRDITHLNVDLARILAGDGSADIILQPHDKLTVKRLPEWADQMVVEVRGEVRFPGAYPIRQGERLSDVLARAGGLTELAFTEGTVFTREDLRIKEQERIEALSRQLEADIAAASLQQAETNAEAAKAIAAARALLPQLKSAQATGRLVIDLPRLLKDGKGSEYDVVLKGGDRLIVPVKSQEVTVIGEVQYPTSHVVESGLDAGDYIQRSGGLTYKADAARAYVVRANGFVEPATSGWWIFRASTADVRPGDTVVVPLDVERMKPLNLWSGVTQILYQIAVSIAVLNNIGAI
jgi:polysaccharide biosynthesis/export protein